jgi:GGDEF domain-containing protein
VDFFRESYGFVAADDLLRAIGRILQDALRDQGNETDFLGHISPNDFVILTRINNSLGMKETLAHRLDQSFDFFYRDQDRQSPDFQTRRIQVSFYEIDPPHSGAVDAQTLKKAMEAVARQK